MSKELDEKWRDLVADGKAKWMPGMSTDGMTVVDADETGISIVRKETIQDHSAPKDAVPDWTDPATLGALLGQVREAWGDPYVYAMRLNVRRQIWVVHVPSDRHNIHGEGETEAAALVAAQEAAP